MVEVKGAGRTLADRLGVEIVGAEGHDLKCGCPLCESSDAGRIHSDTGVYFCFACQKALNAFDLCKVKLGDHKAAIDAMVAVGLFDPPNGNGKPHTSVVMPTDGNGKASDSGKAREGGDLLAEIAAAKSCTVAGFKRYGASVKRDAVYFPQVDENLALCTAFWMSRKELKGRNLKNGTSLGKGRVATGTGLFLPSEVEPYGPRKPKPGECWIITEGVKDASVLSDMGFNVAGQPGNTMKPQFAAMFDGVAVVILPDADEPSWHGAKKTTEALQGHAANVKIARLPSEITPSHGEDSRDVLKRFGDRGPDAIRRAIDEAEPAETALAWMKDKGETDGPPAFIEVISTRDFFGLDLRQQYLVKDAVVLGQPGVDAGRSKTCKTMLGLDLIASVASGRKWLGYFEVPQAASVGVFSFESGAPTIRDALSRIAKSKGLSPDETRDLPISWQFDNRPILSCAKHIDAMGELAAKLGWKLIFVDPLYLTLFGPGDTPKSGDLFAMGQALAPLGDLARNTGAAVYVCHHFRKTGILDNEEPAGLEELSMSGVGEFTRQWILLQRRTPYANDGRHELWARIGGSSGHAGLYGVTINEGVFEPGGFDGRQWAVEVQRVGDVKAEVRKQRETRKAKELEKRDGEHRDRLKEVLRRFPNGETERKLRTVARLNPDNFARALLSLEKDALAEQCPIEKSGRKYDGWRPKS